MRRYIVRPVQSEEQFRLFQSWTRGERVLLIRLMGNSAEIGPGVLYLVN